MRDSDSLSGSAAVFCLSLFKGDVGGFENAGCFTRVAPGEQIGGVWVIVLFKEEDRGDGAWGAAAVARIGVVDGEGCVGELVGDESAFKRIVAFDDGNHGGLVPLAQPCGNV